MVVRSLISRVLMFDVEDPSLEYLIYFIHQKWYRCQHRLSISSGGWYHLNVLLDYPLHYFFVGHGHVLLCEGSLRQLDS